MKIADNLVPFAIFVVRVVRLIVDNEQVTGTHADSFHKVSEFQLLGRRLRTEHLRHDVGFIIVGAVGPLIELLDICQE